MKVSNLIKGKLEKSKRLGRDHNRFNKRLSVLGSEKLSISGNPKNR